MDLTYNYKTQEEIIDDFNVLKKDTLSYRLKMESLIIIKSKKLDIAARKDSIDNYGQMNFTN